MIGPLVEQGFGMHVDLERGWLEIGFPPPGHFLWTEKYERECFNSLNTNTEFIDVVDANSSLINIAKKNVEYNLTLIINHAT